MYSEAFNLGCELVLLPINSAECAMGNSILFKARLERIKKMLGILGLEVIYDSLKMFEDIPNRADISNFLKEKFDTLNNTRDKIQTLIDDSLKDQILRTVFNLGVAIGQIQMHSLEEVVSEESREIFVLIQSLISDLELENNLFQIVKKWLTDYDMIDFVIPMREKEVLELKNKIQSVLIRIE